MTIGTLCKNYGISEEASTALIEKLSKIAGEKYTTKTKLRNSVLDNTYYNYSAGKYTGNTDFSDVPYLTSGSTYLLSKIYGFISSTLIIVQNHKKVNTHNKVVKYLPVGECI